VKKFNTAVIGVGSLGQHHVRVMAAHPQSNLVFVIDTDTARAAEVAHKHKQDVSISADYKDIIGKVDAVVIATPTPHHFQMAKDLLSAGIHCFVEKPITSTLAQADELVALAKEKNLTLQVGHIERFNPAFIAAQPFIKTPKFIEAQRLGPYDPRTAHIGVTMDLMVHDLDVIMSIVKSPVTSVEAHGAKVVSDHEDIVKARIKFENGAVADVSTSRVSPDRYRRMRIFQPENYVSIDFGNKALRVYKPGSTEITTPEIPTTESLYLEAEDFLNSIESGNPPTVRGEEGRAAIELAQRVLDNMTLIG